MNAHRPENPKHTRISLSANADFLARCRAPKDDKFYEASYTNWEPMAEKYREYEECLKNATTKYQQRLYASLTEAFYRMLLLWAPWELKD